MVAIEAYHSETEFTIMSEYHLHANSLVTVFLSPITNIAIIFPDKSNSEILCVGKFHNILFFLKYIN